MVSEGLKPGYTQVCGRDPTVEADLVLYVVYVYKMLENVIIKCLRSTCEDVV